MAARARLADGTSCLGGRRLRRLRSPLRTQKPGTDPFHLVTDIDSAGLEPIVASSAGSLNVSKTAALRATCGTTPAGDAVGIHRENTRMYANPANGGLGVGHGCHFPGTTGRMMGSIQLGRRRLWRKNSSFTEQTKSRYSLGIRLACVHAAILLAVLFSKPALPAHLRSGTSSPSQQISHTGDRLYFDPRTIAGASVIANRAFHYEYESWLFKTLTLLDLPAILLCGLLPDPAWAKVAFSEEVASYWPAAAWFIAGSAQWWACGALIEGRRRRRARRYSAR